MDKQIKLTRRQIEALIAARDQGGALRIRGARMGGAIRRMCERLVDMGLLDDRPPFRLTDAGLARLMAEEQMTSPVTISQ